MRIQYYRYYILEHILIYSSYLLWYCFEQVLQDACFQRCKVFMIGGVKTTCADHTALTLSHFTSLSTAFRHIMRLRQVYLSSG